MEGFCSWKQFLFCMNCYLWMYSIVLRWLRPRTKLYCVHKASPHEQNKPHSEAHQVVQGCASLVPLYHCRYNMLKAARTSTVQMIQVLPMLSVWPSLLILWCMWEASAKSWRVKVMTGAVLSFLASSLTSSLSQYHHQQLLVQSFKAVCHLLQAAVHRQTGCGCSVPWSTSGHSCLWPSGHSSQCRLHRTRSVTTECSRITFIGAHTMQSLEMQYWIFSPEKSIRLVDWWSPGTLVMTSYHQWSATAWSTGRTVTWRESQCSTLAMGSPTPLSAIATWRHVHITCCTCMMA